MDKPRHKMDVVPDNLHLDAAHHPRRRRRHRGWLARRTHHLRHWVRRHKALSVLIGTVLVLFLLVLGWLFLLWTHLNDVDRFDLDLDNRPQFHGGQNILLVGLDCDEAAPVADSLRHCSPDKSMDLSDLEGAAATGNRSDVVMVLHVSEDGSNAQIVSIPRDSYVEVPGHGKTKINAAFSLGGPSLLAQTVEQSTGLYLTNMVVVDFQGFKGISEAIGGVDVFVKEPVTDSRSNAVIWTQGWHRVIGEDALDYVRTRYGLRRGDFDRVQRQQNFLRAVMNRTQTMSVLANPFAVTNLVRALTSNVAVDSEFTNSKLRDLAFTGLKLRTANISYATVPNNGSATMDGASVVLLKQKEMRALFEAIARDQFLTYVKDHTVEILPAEQDVK